MIDGHKPSRDKDRTYRLVVSVLFGLLGFAGSFFCLKFVYGDVPINLNWSLLFPMTITLCWGRRYGLISIFCGLTILYPFFISSANGWACLVCALGLLIWVSLIGYGVDTRPKNKRFYTSIYSLQALYILIQAVLYLGLFPLLYKLNPPFWHTGASTSITFGTCIVLAAKNIILDLTVLAVACSLLQTLFIRRILRLDCPRYMRFNMRIILGMTLLLMAIGVTMSLGVRFLAEKDHEFFSLANMTGIQLVRIFLAAVLGIILGGISAYHISQQIRTKELLEISEKKYSLLYNKMMNSLVIIEPVFDDHQQMTDYIVVDANPEYLKKWAGEKDYFIGKTFSEIFGYRNHFLHYYERMFKTGEPMKFMAHNPEMNDQFNIVNAYMIGENRAALLFQDITDLVKTENELRKVTANLTSIIESTDDLIWSVDGDCRIIYYNSALKKYVREFYNIELVPGMGWDSFADNERNDIWKSFFSRAAREGRFNIDIPIEHRGQYFSVALNPIFKGGEVYAISVFAKDVKEQKKMEQEIKQLNADLERRIEERTAELQNALSELESFTYTVSHDLKAPLRSIEASSRILLEDFPEHFREDIGRSLTSIKTISSDMIAWINKLLLYSTAAGADICPEDIDLLEMFVAVFDGLMLAEKGRDVELSFEDEIPVIYTDKILMKRVVTNVLSNALKFTKQRAKADIVISAERTGNTVIVCVRDNGVGFDPAASGSLFKIFGRLHPSGEFEGHGIGLATVKKLMQRIGGKTWLEGEPGKGASAYLELPMIRKTGESHV